MKVPDFIATNLPRHAAAEATSRLLDPRDRMTAAEYVGLFQTTTDPPRRPESLLEMYSALPRLRQDIEARPQHYTPRQREIAEALISGRRLNPAPTPAEKNELMLRMVRSTETENRHVELTTPRRPTRREATFENQDYGDEIVVI